MSLPRPLRDLLEDGVDEAFVRRAWEGAGRRRRQRAARSGMRLGFALAASASMIALGFTALERTPAPSAPTATLDTAPSTSRPSGPERLEPLLLRGEPMLRTEEEVGVKVARGAVARPSRRRPARIKTVAMEPSFAQLKEADRLRAEGRYREAVDLLQAFVGESQDDPEAPLAMYTVGELLLFELDRPADAKRAFEQALAMGLPSALATTARSRIATAEHRSRSAP